VLEASRKQNVSLIKDISRETYARVQKTLDESVGVDAKTLARRLAYDEGVSASRARLWARDQTLKLNGELTRSTHEEAGVEEYVWSTSSDERVRDRHAGLDGQRFRWDDPPVVSKDGRREHPGGDFQCRCVALPVIEPDNPAR
jgi:SPP1 gp7 family putative phage head morphogenesis protein